MLIPTMPSRHVGVGEEGGGIWGVGMITNDWYITSMPVPVFVFEVYQNLTDLQAIPFPLYGHASKHFITFLSLTTL